MLGAEIVEGKTKRLKLLIMDLVWTINLAAILHRQTFSVLEISRLAGHCLHYQRPLHIPPSKPHRILSL